MPGYNILLLDKGFSPTFSLPETAGTVSSRGNIGNDNWEPFARATIPGPGTKIFKRLPCDEEK
jgi:hypothetical protein